MQLAQQQLRDLVALLRECTAEIRGGSRSRTRGTGFFITDRDVLTCAHVTAVEAGGTVEVTPSGHPPRVGEVVATLPELAEDLAVVRILEPDSTQPAVVLHPFIDDESVPFRVVGYPREPLLHTEERLETVHLTGHPRFASDGVKVDQLIFDAGHAIVEKGLSGGAVLDPSSGAVVALAQYARNANAPHGGGGIPIARAAERFELVRACLDEPPLATARWRETLGPDAWRQLGKPPWHRRIDVSLRGTRQTWHVAVDGESGGDYPMTFHELPQEGSEALFRWAQRRGVRNSDDVRLLGKLLCGAVFPNGLQARLAAELGADELLVCLHVDRDSDLFDVPWELATLDAQGRSRYVAAEERVALVRIADGVAHAQPHDLVEPGVARVLAIVAQPQQQHRRMPAVTHKWPTEQEICHRFVTAVDQRLRPTPLASPTYAQVEHELRQPPPEGESNEIVHYVGFGTMRDGVAVLALSDGETGIQWYPASRLFDLFGHSGARLVVVELMHAPTSEDYDPIPPRAFLAALTSSVEAVVFTRFPLHPRQFQPFNDELYRVLAEGRSVETAVQRGRADVCSNQYLDDAAGFGSFTVLTGPRADTRIVCAPQEQHEAAGTDAPQAPPYGGAKTRRLRPSRREARHPPASFSRSAG